MLKKLIIAIVFIHLSILTSFGQDVDYSNPQSFIIENIKVEGAEFSDDNALISISGLNVGQKIKIPGSEIPTAIKNIWRLRLFEDVIILKDSSTDQKISIIIKLVEKPRLAKYSFKGAKKSSHDDLNAVLEDHLVKGSIVTENSKLIAASKIKEYYRGKGYPNAVVNIIEKKAKGVNKIRLVLDIDRKERVKIYDVVFTNTTVKQRILRKKMKETRRKRYIFSSSKFREFEYKQDKKAIIDYYNSIGFRNAKIERDSVWENLNGDLIIAIQMNEGNLFHYRNIKWKGNSIYSTDHLQRILGIKKGDIYNNQLFEERLRFSQEGRDVTTLYMDNGYLFFQIDPVEVAVDNDSIDIELRIFEGPQATIDRVVINGNDRTHEHVIRRELRTKPGKKFSRSDIIRSQREIINLGYFNPEALGVNTPVNPQRGTVDIEYTVEEKPSDQLELSAGWGGRGRGVIGTLGITFNNFSLRNIGKRESWNPLPQGDGQKLSLRAQTNGRFYQSYNFSFTEPWLGGKKPNSFTLGGYFSQYTNGVDKNTSSFSKLGIGNIAVGIGTRLKFPDDNFISNTTLNFQVIDLFNWNGNNFPLGDGQFLNDGKFFNFTLNQTIARTSINDPIFPTSGSKFSLVAQLSPPYSFLKKAVSGEQSLADKYRWLEYHKWKFNAEWYSKIVGKLTLKAAYKFGTIGTYRKNEGVIPFERFVLGGDGLSNANSGFLGYDLISLRGYDVENLPASDNGGATTFNKFTVELRYPFSTNPNSTIFALAFFEGGNSWSKFRDFNPFDMRRSVGLGLRIFLPMFGTLGFDYGIGFDKYISPNNDQSVFEKYGKLSIILGFEPE